MNDKYLNWIDKNGIRSIDVIKMTRLDLLRQTGIDKIPDIIDPVKIGCLEFEREIWKDELKYLEELTNELQISCDNII